MLANKSDMMIQFLYLIPVILLSLSFHEFAHAFVSYKLGDPTAKSMGRLTLNPLKHLDPVGTIMLVISGLSGSGIGWAKPVPIDPRYYKDARRGTMLTSLAGPVSNVLLAVIFAFPVIYIETKYASSGVSNFNYFIYTLSSKFIIINLGLAVFNILPVPPLDGSKILSGILPPEQYFKLMQYENYIGIIFIIVVFAFPSVLQNIMTPIVKSLWQIINLIVNPIINMLT